MKLSHCLQLAAGAAVLLLTLNAANSADTAKAMLKDQKGKDVGTVEFTQTPAGVLLRLALKGLPAGEHAFHVHEAGKCEAPFKSAGGHFNPGKHKHGVTAGTAHAGDMPNLHVPQSGELMVEVLNASITLDKGKPNSVFHDGGTAIIIHAGKDDYKTDPDGAAGERIACGVIEQGGGATVGGPRQ